VHLARRRQFPDVAEFFIQQFDEIYESIRLAVSNVVPVKELKLLILSYPGLRLDIPTPRKDIVCKCI